MGRGARGTFCGVSTVPVHHPVVASTAGISPCSRAHQLRSRFCPMGCQYIAIIIILQLLLH